MQVPMPGAQQREAILEIMLQRHAEEQGAEQVEPRLLANKAAAGGKQRPLQLIAGALRMGNCDAVARLQLDPQRNHVGLLLLLLASAPHLKL